MNLFLDLWLRQEERWAFNPMVGGSNPPKSVFLFKKP